MALRAARYTYLNNCMLQHVHKSNNLNKPPLSYCTLPCFSVCTQLTALHISTPHTDSLHLEQKQKQKNGVFEVRQKPVHFIFDRFRRRKKRPQKISSVSVQFCFARGGNGRQRGRPTKLVRRSVCVQAIRSLVWSRLVMPKQSPTIAR